MFPKYLNFFICAALLLVHSVARADHTSVEQRYSDQREVFQELTGLLQSGELTKAISRRDELDGYPLTDYFDYLVLRKQIEQSSKPADLLGQIAKQNRDKRLQRRLLGVVKNRSVKLNRWQDYNLAWAYDNAPNHPCDDLLAGYINGHPKRFEKQTRELWADVDRHTPNCDKAFSMLLEEVKDVPTAALWRRTVALIKRGKLESAESLLKYFNSRDAKIVRAWIDGYKDPAKALQSQSIQGQTVYHREIAELFLRRWRRDDLPAALEYWRSNAKSFGFSKKDINESVAKYTVLAAKRGLPESLELLKRAPEDRDVRYWNVRLALRDRNWQRCLAAIDQLTEEEQLMPRWQYWRARCLDAQGFQAAADRIYQNIAGDFEYYGFLAADKLSQDYAIETSTTGTPDIHELKDDPRIGKALEYFFIDLPWEGRSEWNRALKGASKKQFMAAAQLAGDVGWYDRMMSAAFQAGATDTLRWRFPQAYEIDVRRYADHYNIPSEFVYGVMRRESRFKADVKSPAGAVGLMQLMPATAKQMGKQIGVEAPAWRLIDSKLNIRLGVRYLDHVLDRFNNNFAYAAAAYNAGPSRVKAWVADRPFETDLWVETIPFDETRAYVQAVLFNTVVSEWLVKDGSVTRLADRMDNISITQLLE